MPADRAQNLKRAFICIAAGILVAIAVYYEGVNLLAWHYAEHNPLTTAQNLSIVPTPLPDSRLAELAGLRVQHYGYSIQTPWQQVVGEMADRRGDLSSEMFRFANGVGVALLQPASKLLTLADLNDGAISDRIIFHSLRGLPAAQSNFGLFSAEVAATPDEARWWKLPDDNTRLLVLLAMKNIDLNRTHSIHPIAGGSVRGYQFGDPSGELVHLFLFDSRDREYQIVLGRKGSLAPLLTQPQINAMVASLSVTRWMRIPATPPHTP